MPGGSSGASVGVWGRGKTRPVPFGPDGSVFSSTTVFSVVVVVVSAAIVVVVVVVKVVGGTGEETVMGGSGGAGASVRLIEGKVGGYVGVAETFGGPGRGKGEEIVKTTTLCFSFKTNNNLNVWSYLLISSQ